MAKQTSEELEGYLKEHRAFIARSSEAYDNGHVDEAKRIAVSIRVLVHDTKSSHSLFSQLGIKESAYLDTASPATGREFGSYKGLVFTQLGGGTPAAFVPKCSLPPKPSEEYSTLGFDEWWNGIVIKDTDGNEFSRKQLVLSLANKVGGAHVDPNLDQEFSALYGSGSHGVSTIHGESSIPVSGIELASVRQIGFELISMPWATQ